MKIRGAIQFELSVDENNEWDIVYEDNIDNQVAILAISKAVLEQVCAGLSLESKNAKNTKYEKHIKAILEKGRAGHFGLEVVLEYMQNIYLDFKKHNPDVVPSVADEAKATETGLKLESAVFNEYTVKLNSPMELTEDMKKNGWTIETNEKGERFCYNKEFFEKLFKQENTGKPTMSAEMKIIDLSNETKDN